MLCVTCKAAPAKWQDQADSGKIFCDSRICQIGLKTDFSSKGEKIDQDDLVGLVSSDGIKFEIVKDNAAQSKTLLELIETVGLDNYIDFPNMDSQTLGIIADYLNNKYIDYDELDIDLIDRLILASRFLDLVDLNERLISMKQFRQLQSTKKKTKTEQTITWLNLHQFFLSKDVRKLIYKYLTKDDMKMVELAHNSVKKFQSSIDFTHYCAKHGYLDLIKWAKGWDVFTLANAAEYGHLDILEYLLPFVRDNYNRVEDDVTYKNAMLNPIVCTAAAKSGKLYILQWLRANGFVWSEMAMVFAAQTGHLDVLKWAYENGCAMTSQTSVAAVVGGHLPILEYLHSIGMITNPILCLFAAHSGRLNVLNWLRTHNVPWNDFVVSVAAEDGHLHIMQWAVENGAPWDPELCLEIAREKNYKHIVKWIENL